MDGRGCPEHAPSTGPTRALTVYGMPDCPGWRRATMLATLVENAGIPGVTVEIVDLACLTEPVPHAVIASPTWLLDGRRIALGNPDPAWLLALLGALAEGA